MNTNPVDPTHANPVVDQCWQAGRAAYLAGLAQGKNEQAAQHLAGLAYRSALPALKGARNTRNFIACVTFGSLMGVLPGKEATRLLYAAQIAYNTRRTRKRRKAPTPSSSDTSQSGSLQTAPES